MSNENEYRAELEGLLSKYDEELNEMSGRIADNLRSNSDFAEIIWSDIEYDLDMGIRFEMYQEVELFNLYINVDTNGSDSGMVLSDDQGEQIRDFVGDIYREHFKAFSSKVLSKSDREKWLQAFSKLFNKDINDGNFFEADEITARVQQNGERYVDE